MNGAARFLNNLYGNLVGTINGFTVAKSVPSNAVFTDTKYTAATAAPGKVASSSSTGTSANYARQDHTHGIDLATGDSNGQVKIAGTNVSVKGLGAAAYMGTGTSSSTVAVGNHTHKYAGSSSAGGSANSAVKLDSTNVGSASCPVYFSSGGKPVAVSTTAAAASGGTALTVVTTGEKFNWNEKMSVLEMTKAEYDALPVSKQNDGTVYMITDDDGGWESERSIYNNIDSSLTATNVQDALDELDSKKADTYDWYVSNPDLNVGLITHVESNSSQAALQSHTGNNGWRLLMGRVGNIDLYKTTNGGANWSFDRAICLKRADVYAAAVSVSTATEVSFTLPSDYHFSFGVVLYHSWPLDTWNNGAVVVIVKDYTITDNIGRVALTTTQAQRYDIRLSLLYI